MNRCPSMPILRFLRTLIVLLVWGASVSSSLATAQTLQEMQGFDHAGAHVGMTNAMISFLPD